MPNFELLCRQYLRDTENISNGSARSERPLPVTTRRSTVSSTNLFNVDGVVNEMGSDFLPRPGRNSFLYFTYFTHFSNFQNRYHDYTFLIYFFVLYFFSYPVYPVSTANNANDGLVQQERQVHEGREVDPIDVTEDTNDSNDPRPIVSTVERVELIEPQGTQVEEAQSISDEPGPSGWVPTPSRFIDPFRRTSGGFQIYGRRSSVCVMTSVPEN